MKKSVFEQILEEMEQEKYRFVPDAIEAIDNGDEKRIDLFLHYNAETAAAMLEQRYDKIPPGTRFETALYHYTDKGDGIDIIRRVIKANRIGVISCPNPFVTWKSLLFTVPPAILLMK
mgnify:CR=1 FL=1